MDPRTLFRRIQLGNEIIFDDSSDEEDLELLLNYYECAYETEDDRGPLRQFFQSVSNGQPMTLLSQPLTRLSPDNFMDTLRLKSSTFEYILTKVAPTIEKYIIEHDHRPTISTDKQLLLTLWFYTTAESLRSICERFNVGKATVSRSIRRITSAIYPVGPSEVRWPEGTRVDEVIVGFESISGFPRVIGVVDCTHIEIPPPKKNASLYLNRFRKHSIVLQASCDHTAKFTDYDIGQVGQVHNARVLRLSELIDNPAKYPNNTHLVGSAEYPCSDLLLVPFKDNGKLTTKQLNYNTSLLATKSVIDRAFRLLKGRFHCLKFLDMLDMNEIVCIIASCCVLHNICMERGETAEEDRDEGNGERNGWYSDEDELCEEHGHENDVMRDVKRNEVMNQLRMKPRRVELKCCGGNKALR